MSIVDVRGNSKLSQTSVGCFTMISVLRCLVDKLLYRDIDVLISQLRLIDDLKTSIMLPFGSSA